MARKSVIKGKVFEREVAATFRKLYPDARRGIVQARAGNEAPDVDGTPFWVECKIGHRVTIQAALTQAVEATDGRPPLAVCKVDRQPATVTLRLPDFINLLSKDGN